MPLVLPLSSFKGKNILLITHSGCDVDAICAAASLFFSLKAKNRAEIIVPDHIALPAKTFAKKLGIPYRVVKGFSLKGFDCLFLVDFNELKMAPGLEQELNGFRGQVFIVDHHRPPQNKEKQKLFVPVEKPLLFVPREPLGSLGRKPKGLLGSIGSQQNSLVDQNAVASCEIVFDWLKKSGIEIDKKTATCIAAGIVTDSAFFLTANSRTFAIMSETLEKSGLAFSALTPLFSVKQTFDEKVAKLKAAKRARIFLVSDYIVVASDVGAFEADAASALTRIGADIAFVGDSDDGKLRISGRALQNVVKKEGFDLAKHVFQRLPGEFGGSGGGHAGAAGFNGKGKDINAALMQCVSLTREYFKKRKGYRFKEYT